MTPHSLRHLVSGLELAEGGRLPTGYAVAYWRPWSMHVVCYPIGLHLLVSLVRSAYTRLQHARCPEGWETLYRVRESIGYEKGRTAGYDAALRHLAIVREAQRPR